MHGVWFVFNKNILLINKTYKSKYAGGFLWEDAMFGDIIFYEVKKALDKTEGTIKNRGFYG